MFFSAGEAARDGRIPVRRGRRSLPVDEKPRLLVIDREGRAGPAPYEGLAEAFDLVYARSMARALGLLREHAFVGVFVDAAQALGRPLGRHAAAGRRDPRAIADGVAVVDPELTITWVNPEFRLLAGPQVDPIGVKFYRALNSPEVLGPDPCPFTSAIVAKAPANTVLRIDASHYLRVTVTPMVDAPARSST
jgi:PAS domain-containing protein